MKYQTKIYTSLSIVFVIMVVFVTLMIVRSNPKESGGEKETYSLMGIEMTEKQAIEHCQVMPNMDGCAPFLK
jgi:hypothetical protein